MQINPNIDREPYKYPPLAKYGLKVVMSTTKFITTNVVAMANYIADIPQVIKSKIESLVVKMCVRQFS